MGADEAVLVSDPALNELDTAGAARVLAAAIQKIGPDMIIFGRQTLDNGSGLTPAQTARILGLPMLSWAGHIKVEEESCMWIASSRKAGSLSARNCRQ